MVGTYYDAGVFIGSGPAGNARLSKPSQQLQWFAGGTMKREDVLAKRTHKQDGLDVARRVFYTLKGEEPEIGNHGRIATAKRLQCL